ncbi:hypothetical protein AJ80_06572 [Polytolypa hystricis UAMH7299]|uniref:Uncharacterized protein n=1 Tax=Polytolypa hystricis (strain UAMH7299) TaxID=1447883 RepID=A0A2B7XVP8_POLH7|nr:hypothetical protein AJ80_06572 [Polytolypa hystricis UAMH7299]
MFSGTSFLQFWLTDRTRDAFLASLPKEDLLSMRLVCFDFSVQTAPLLFSDVDIEFRSSTFTRPARMAALERIGHHIKTLSFRIPHSPATFLPPLLDPITGEEQTFVYSPQVHAAQSPGCRLSNPKYGTWEMTELLTKQYPPLFHAATNVPSFIRAISTMTNLAHLKISCDGQVSAHRYRRSVVDYALISLRIAIEQGPLKALDTLSLLPIHPGATFYLSPNMGFGASPASRKRWTQIRKLTIHMDSFPCEPGMPTDHLKLLHSYLQGFPKLTKFAFRWRGAKGPCPLSLPTEPCLVSPFSTPAPQACRNRSSAPLKPLKFPSLRYMELENAVLDASQVSVFILDHRRTLREFDFEHTLLRTGSWDEALAPLTRISGSDRWKKQQQEVMDVPLILSPVGLEPKEIRKVIWEEERRKDKLKNFRAYRNLQRASIKTKPLLWCNPEHMKRLLRTSVFSWR